MILVRDSDMLHLFYHKSYHYVCVITIIIIVFDHYHMLSTLSWSGNLYHRSLRQEPFTIYNKSTTFQGEAGPTKVREILSSLKEGLIEFRSDVVYTSVLKESSQSLKRQSADHILP
jgi:hypothetical protein